MGDGAVLTIAVNLDAEPAKLSPLEGPVLFETTIGASDAARSGELPAFTTIALLERPA